MTSARNGSFGFDIMKPFDIPVGYAPGATKSNLRRGVSGRRQWRSMSRKIPAKLSQSSRGGQTQP